MTVSEDFLLYSEYQVLHDTPKLQIISDIKKKNSCYSKQDA